MNKLLKPKGKTILLGNEAIVRGALESGIGLASTYPGTPSSEIGDSFSKIARKAGIYFEYSTNEKVATEAAAGAAFSGVKSLVAFKHFGFNVASDSIFPLAYHSVKAGMVIVSCDDPGCWSSGQSEQDSRYYARIAHMPLLEPSDPQECKDFTKFAFKLSEKFKIPVIIRSTTRVSHASGVVSLGKIVKGRTKGKFVKNLKFRNMPPAMINVHAELNNKLEQIKKLNVNIKIPGKGKIGIITAGVSYNYVLEAMRMLNVKLPVLKLGMTWPFQEKVVKNFIKNLKSVLIVEELEPIIEKEVKVLAKEVEPKLIVYGKNYLPGVCELRQEVVAEAMAKVIGKNFKSPRIIEQKIPKRLPVLCPGCPHRAAFWSVKKATPKGTVYGGDIGCYILGIFPPNDTADYIISMGACEGVSHGISKTNKQKPVAFIGDSTFFHAGVPALINTVYNKSNVLIVALDNRWTAMTGHQPNPGTGITGMGEKTKELKIEEIAKACGVDNVIVVNAYNLNDSIKKTKELFSKKTSSVLVVKGECRLQFMRRIRKQGLKIPRFRIDPEKCIKCGICLYEFGCPAIQKKSNEYYIDEDLCWGCTACTQVCPVKAISPGVKK